MEVLKILQQQGYKSDKGDITIVSVSLYLEKKLNTDYVEKKYIFVKNEIFNRPIAKYLTWCTSNSIGIACKTRATITYPSVISWGAICILCTITWIYTLFISTSKCSRAIRVCETFWFPTSIIRVPYMSW